MFYKVNRLSLLHRTLRKFAYTVLRFIPEKIKFNIMHYYLRNIPPYKFVSDGDTVVQIGAPSDILETGRSRWTHLAKLVGTRGKLVLVEPDEDNIRAINHYILKRSLKNIVVVEKGCWSEEAQKTFLVDRDNPAANLVGEVFDVNRTDRNRFTEIIVPVDKLDNILAEISLESCCLISVTANGSENEILLGARETMKKCKYLSIVGSVEKIPALKFFKYKEMVYDDRGTTFLGTELE